MDCLRTGVQPIPLTQHLTRSVGNAVLCICTNSCWFPDFEILLPPRQLPIFWLCRAKLGYVVSTITTTGIRRLPNQVLKFLKNKTIIQYFSRQVTKFDTNSCSISVWIMPFYTMASIVCENIPFAFLEAHAFNFTDLRHVKH